jgi:hypothetical protein
MLVLVLLGLALWTIEMPSGPGRLVGYLLVAMAAGLLSIHFIARSAAASRFAERVLTMRGFAKLQGKVLDKLLTVGRTMGDSYRLFGNTIYPIILLALTRHILGIVSFWLVAMALDLHISFLTIGWIRVVMHALLMLPISLAGIGVREGSLVVLLQEYAVLPNEAVALAFLLFVVTLLSNSTGGLFEIRNLLSPRPADERLRSGTK